VAGIVIAYNHSETFRNYVNGLWQELQQLWGWLSANVPQLVSWFVDGFGKAEAATDAFWAKVGALPGEIGGALQQANAATDTFWQNVQSGFQQANAATDSFWQNVAALPGKLGAALGPLAQQVWNWVVEGWNRAKDGVAQANQFLLDKVSGFIQSLTSTLSGLAQKVYDWVAGGFARLPQPVQDAITTVVGYVSNLGTQIMQSLQNLPSQMVNMGHDIINGLLQGLQQLGPQIVSYLTNLIPEPVRKALNISSPSGVMRDIGTNIMQGLDQGISSLIPQLQAKMAQIGQMLQAQGQQAAANVANTLSSLDLSKIGNVKAQISASGASGSATIGGQQVSGSIDKSGIHGSIGGQTFNVDARSFGSQLNPKDVIDQILWKAKAGGLVPA
jgi:hypothetical protein